MRNLKWVREEFQQISYCFGLIGAQCTPCGIFQPCLVQYPRDNQGKLGTHLSAIITSVCKHLVSVYGGGATVYVYADERIQGCNKPQIPSHCKSPNMTC